MTRDFEAILEDLGYYAHQLDVVGSVLVDLIRSRSRHPQLVEEAAEVYQLLTLDIIEIYGTLKRVYRGSHTLGARQSVPLEVLENAFVTLRDAAEEAESKARKLEKFRSREAKIVKAEAKAISSLAENAAKVLVSEAHKLGRWTVEWERELGLRPWLR